MELFGTVQPLVLTLDGYGYDYGDEEPADLAMMQQHDKDTAEQIAGTLHDLFFLETDLAEPKEGEGLAEEIGSMEDLEHLRTIAASINGKTPADYQEGRVEAGYQFNHLINHAGDSGYYLPVDFPQSFVLKDLSLGSAPALLQELNALESVLAAQFPDEMHLALSTSDEQPRPEIAGPVGIWFSLRRLCRSAIALHLPLHLG